MQFEEMKQALSDAAARAGVGQYEIYYQKEDGISAETLKNEISAFSSSVAGGICFRCIVDGKMGYASGERMTAEDAEEMVRRAVSNARCIDSEDEVFIFEGSPSYRKLPERDIALADPAMLRDIALRLQKETYAADPRVSDGTQSSVGSMVGEVHIYNSNGLSLCNRTGCTYAYAMPVVRDGEEAQEDYSGKEGITYEDFADLPAKAVAGAAAKLHAVPAVSGKYDIVMDGRQFRSFLSTFSSVFSAKNVQMGLSLLAGKEGTQVASPLVTVIDDPMREGSLLQTPFDDEGVATSRRNVIENGVLKTFLYDLSTAKKAGVASTGNGQKSGYAAPVTIAPYHFSLEAGTKTREELFEAVGTGIYITECKGFHAGANAVTGDFSIESAGFMIRDGKLAEAVRSFTVAGNFFDLLRQIDGVGNEMRWSIAGSFPVFGSPDVLIRGASVAGK